MAVVVATVAAMPVVAAEASAAPAAAAFQEDAWRRAPVLSSSQTHHELQHLAASLLGW